MGVVFRLCGSGLIVISIVLWLPGCTGASPTSLDRQFWILGKDKLNSEARHYMEVVTRHASLEIMKSALPKLTEVAFEDTETRLIIISASVPTGLRNISQHNDKYVDNVVESVSFLNDLYSRSCPNVGVIVIGINQSRVRILSNHWNPVASRDSLPFDRFEWFHCVQQRNVGFEWYIDIERDKAWRKLEQIIDCILSNNTGKGIPDDYYWSFDGVALYWIRLWDGHKEVSSVVLANPGIHYTDYPLPQDWPTNLRGHAIVIAAYELLRFSALLQSVPDMLENDISRREEYEGSQDKKESHVSPPEKSK